MAPYVIGVDPGKKCGLAFYDHGDSPASVRFESCTLSSEDAINIVRMWLDPELVWDRSVLVVCERYTIGGRTVKMSRQPRALEVIGVVRDMCEHAHVRFVLQNPADAKKMGHAQRLKDLGWWKTGDIDDDANMAAAHVLLGLATHFPVVFGRLVRPVQ